MANYNMVAEHKRLGHEGWPYDCLKMETHAGLSHGGVVWDTPMAKWAGEGKEWVQEIMKNPPKKNVNVALLGNDKTACDMKKTRGVTSNEPRKLDPMVLDTSREGKGI